MKCSAIFNMLISILGLGLFTTVAAINAAVPLGTAYESNGALLADSEVYDWTYKLDPSAPLLYTRDDILAKAADFDGKARVERLNGQLVLVSSDLNQIGTLTGDVETDIESIYPDAAGIANARSIVQQQGAQLSSGNAAAQTGAVGQVEPGISPRTPFGLEKREVCGGCFFIWQCSNYDKDPPKCHHTFCVIVFCIGKSE